VSGGLIGRRIFSGFSALALIVFLLANGWCVVASAQSAQSAQDSSPSAELSRVQAEIASIKAREDLSDSARRHALDTYQQAVAALQAAQLDRKKTVELRHEASSASDRVNSLQHQLSDIGKPASIESLKSLSMDTLAERASALRSKLSVAQAQLTSLRNQLTQLAQRPEEARNSLAEARNSLRQKTTRTLGPTAQDSLVTQAQQALQAARREALNAQIERLRQELAGMDSRERVLEAQRALAEAQVANDNDSLAAVQAALGQEQKASAKSLQQASESKFNELRSALAPISQAAQRNVELTHELSKVSADAQMLSQRQLTERARVEDLERRLNLVQRQLEIGGGSIALGDVLRNQRRRLADPVLPFLTANDDSKVPDIAAAELQRFQLQQDRADLDDPASMAKRLAAKAGVSLSDGQLDSLAALIKQRRSIIDQLIDAESRYVDMGRDLQSLSRQYNDTLSSFNRLLDERLFWLPSFRPIGVDWPGRVAADLPWIFNPRSWRAAVASFFKGLAARPFIAGFGALVIAGLIAIRRPLRRRMRKLGEPVGNVSHDTFWLTSRVVLITALLSLPSALLPMLIGYLTQHAPGASDFTRAAAAGVFQLGMLWLFIEPYASVCRTNGLADRHFQWPEDARRGLHRNLRWLLAALILPVIVITITEAFDEDSKRETLGRAAFMFGQISIAIFAWRLLHPRHGALADVLTGDQNDPWRLGYLWLPVSAGSALALAGLAALGYYYTAVQLQTRFFYSAALLGACMIGYSLIVRWLTIAERRLALSRALRKREEAREARASREAAAVAGDSTPENLDAVEIDLVQISEQTRGLIKVIIALATGAGLWLIWSGTLPALQLLNNINLWQYASEINGHTQVTNVTLGAVLLAIAVGMVTALAGRNLPGFLEITILRRFSMDAGSRYAMAKLFQYAIVTFGLLVAVNLIGLRWSSIQWLVAAVGVGLGFGLQEIFANFVSGIVILFERPVRVGDTVTVGTLTGTVSRIRIRATTVTDWDNKEVVIPNKTFITETVINWTLTDDITRLVIKVGVAFDADGELVEKLIYQAIKAEPVALDNPAPSVFMVGYGDSAVLFEARVFYHDLYYLLPLQHALYRRIHKAFDEHGIEIVFPQRDLHLRSVDESVGRLFRSADRRERRKNVDDVEASPRLPPGGVPDQ
jgi:potassium efflux system protein